MLSRDLKEENTQQAILLSVVEDVTKQGHTDIARLIAAAPELLAAAKETLNRFEFEFLDLGLHIDWFKNSETLRAAIAKAEGK